MANLLAERGFRNTFQIELLDKQGTMQKAVPDHIVYTVGAVIEEQPLLKSVGLGKADNSDAATASDTSALVVRN